MTQFSSAPRFHHVGVQTSDLDNSLAWYRDFLGCVPAWSTDVFSDLTRSRLPGVVRLTEMVLGDIRFHLCERPTDDAQPPSPDTAQFQHLCLAVADPAQLKSWRDRWSELYDSGRYAFTDPAPATEIVTDDQGVQSFYCLDVNGLELEFTYIPGGHDE